MNQTVVTSRTSEEIAAEIVEHLRPLASNTSKWGGATLEPRERERHVMAIGALLPEILRQADDKWQPFLDEPSPAATQFATAYKQGFQEGAVVALENLREHSEGLDEMIAATKLRAVSFAVEIEPLERRRERPSEALFRKAWDRVLVQGDLGNGIAGVRGA